MERNFFGTWRQKIKGRDTDRGRLNLLCILLFAAVIGGMAIDFTLNMREMVSDFQLGEKEAIDFCNVDGSIETDYPPVVSKSVSLAPYDICAPMDSVLNRRTGEMLPVQFRDMQVLLPADDARESESVILDILAWLAGFVFIACMVIFWVSFVRMIISINKGIVFDLPVRRRLSRMGWMLIVCYAAMYLTMLPEYVFARKFIEIENAGVVFGYENAMFLYTGVGLLLFAQILKIGCRMKEEQELTV